MGSHALMAVLAFMYPAVQVHTHANTAVIALKNPKTSCSVLCTPSGSGLKDWQNLLRSTRHGSKNDQSCAGIGGTPMYP